MADAATGETDCSRSEDTPTTRASSDAVLSRHLAAILEEQLRVNLRTVEALQSMIDCRSADNGPKAAAPFATSAADSADPWAALERRRQDLEREGEQFLADSAQHSTRLRQFEEDAQARLHDITAEIFNQYQGDCRQSIDRIEQIVSILEQAEAQIAELCGGDETQPQQREETHSYGQSEVPSIPVAAAADEPIVAPSPQPAEHIHVEQPTIEPQASSLADEPELTQPEQPAPASSIVLDMPEEQSQPDEPAPFHSIDVHNPGDAESRRTTHRLKVESLESNLGPVDDLSHGGARVLSSKPLEGEVHFEVTASDVTFAVTATVAWCERHTWRHYAAGIQFGPLSEQDAQKLTRICMETRKQTTIAG